MVAFPGHILTGRVYYNGVGSPGFYHDPDGGGDANTKIPKFIFYKFTSAVCEQLT